MERLARIEIAGTGIYGPTEQLFVWPRARDYDRGRTADFEEDELKWEGTIEQPTVDFQGFPSDALDRCIIVAGPGYGKSALLGAIAARLVRTPYVPILVPLASFATSDVGVLKFLTNDVNRELEIRVEWSRLAEHLQLSERRGPEAGHRVRPTEGRLRLRQAPGRHGSMRYLTTSGLG